MKKGLRDRQVWALILAYVTAFIFAGVSVQYAQYVDSESNHRWCQLLDVLTESYRTQPPESSTGQLVAREITMLHTEFNC
jgi:hypothetical protein